MVGRKHTCHATHLWIRLAVQVCLDGGDGLGRRLSRAAAHVWRQQLHDAAAAAGAGAQDPQQRIKRCVLHRPQLRPEQLLQQHLHHHHHQVVWWFRAQQAGRGL